jgi:glycosyltransferase involved in cell wall biosynthesis
VVPPERPPARALAATAKYRTIDAVNRLRRAPVRRRVYILVLSADERTGVTTTMTSLANELCQRHDVEIISLFKMDDDARLPLDPRIHLSYLENLRQPAGAPGPRILRAKNNPHRHPDDRRLDGLKSQLFDDSAPTSRLTDLLLERRLKTLRPGVLLSNRPMLHLAAARWAPKHTSVIAVEHATFLQRQEGILKLYSRIADRLAAIVTLTPQDQAAFQELVSGRTQVALIPNGVPSPGQQVSSLDSKVIVSAGELIGRKGFDRLIDAFAPLAAGHPDWRVEIYGQGSKQQELKDQIRRLDLEGQVLLKGFDKNFQETLRNASIYAMGSRFEAFPMVLLEAMSVGLPVISFDCPSGPGNLITDGEDGLLIPDDDIAAYTAGLEKLMDDEYRRRLAKGALQTIAKYDVSAIATRWEQLFDEVV